MEVAICIGVCPVSTGKISVELPPCVSRIGLAYVLIVFPTIIETTAKVPIELCRDVPKMTYNNTGKNALKVLMSIFKTKN